jgi:hypothetical protein
MHGLVVATVGFFAAIAGGVLQAWSARRFERERFGRQARYDAYADYFRAVGKLSFARTEGATDEAHAAVAEARGRVALYGSPEVVSSMAIAFRHGEDLHSDQAWPAHAAMIAAMRADVNGDAAAAPERDLFELLYGAKSKEGDQ